MSCICVLIFVQKTNWREHAKAMRTQKKVQMLIVKLTFSDLFLSLFFHFYFRFRSFETICLCSAVCEFDSLFLGIFVFDGVFFLKWNRKSYAFP